jgi:UDP-3-O-[3-hydroxymyristoyl] N-acetylglucosamine deacetylase
VNTSPSQAQDTKISELAAQNLPESAPGLLARTQRTLAQAIEASGVGLHSGEVTQVRVCPATENAGRYFVRMDEPGQPQIPARIQQVHQTVLSTELQAEGHAVRTVEHLLAALAGMGIDNARIEVTGAEVPLLDGSALPWVEAIAQAGIVEQAIPRPTKQLETPLWVREGEAFVAALPAEHLRLSYGIDFESAAIGQQWYSWSPAQEPFERAIAPARTFGLAHQVEYLQQQGLIKGGNLDNALVCDEGAWLNPPLRFSNEPVRHKLLDLVGDMSLLGVFPVAHIVAYKASHRLHAQLALQLASRVEANA